MATDLENWSVEKWLKKIGMRKYKQAFLDNGYETADLCASLNKEDLDAIGVTNKNHRSTLFTQSRELLKLVDKESLLASEDSVDFPKGSPAPSSGSSRSGSLPQIGRTPPPLSNPPVTTLGHIESLPDYSEPWNSNAGPPVPTSPAPKIGGGSQQQQLPKPANGTAADPKEGHSPARNAFGGSGNRKKPQVSSGSDLPAFKKTGSAGYTKLQLKLKIREELFTRGVVLSEYPYCTEDGSPDEQLVMDLAEELSNKFDVESLDMYDALQAVWSNANKSDFATAKRKPKVTSSALREPTDNYDEPFDSVSSASNTPQHSAGPVAGAGKGSPPTPGKTSPGKSTGKKSRTLPAQATPPSPSQPNGCYDEPFDSVSPSTGQLTAPPTGLSSPEKKRVLRVENSQTLPSPSRQRKSVDSALPDRKGGRSPKTSPKLSPKLSPLHPAPTKSKFSLFRRKEKARSQSVRDSDVKFLGGTGAEAGKKGVISFPSKGGGALVTPSGRIRQVVSAEDVSEPSTDQLAHLKSGVPPPLPSPRPKHPDESSEESENSPSINRTKKHGGKVFKKFITPPTLQRNQIANFDNNSLSSTCSETGKIKNASSHIALYQTSKTSDDEDYEGKAWLRTSKSFDNLTRVDSPPKLHKDKKSKSKTPKFITRIFKRKSVTPASLRRGEKGGKSVKARGDQRDSYRDSYVSTASSVSESRERCLTASMSMPDISNIIQERKSRQKPSATPPEQRRQDNSSYAEVFDAIKPSPEVLSRYSPKSSRKHLAPQTSGDKSPPTKPTRLSQGSQPPSSPPGQEATSPIAITPPHQKMFIRAGSESSGPDNITITTLKPASAPEAGPPPEFMMGGDVVTISTSGIVSSSSGGAISSAASFDSAKSADSEEQLLSEAMRRTGSAGSTASEVSGGGSLPRKRPPLLPKPQALGKPTAKPTSTSPAHSKSESTTPAKPPPKPATLRRPTPTSKSSSSPSRDGAKSPNPTSPHGQGESVGKTSPTATPRRTAVANGVTSHPGETSALTNGVKLSPRPTRSSVPNMSDRAKPPPKPLRSTLKRPRPQSKSESEPTTADPTTTTGTTLSVRGGDTRGASSPPTSPFSSPVQPNSSSELESSGQKPPPKPIRKGKSVKIVENPDYSSTTLPSSFKTGHKLAPSLPITGPGGNGVGSGSPKPVPKPRTSVGTLPQPVKRPRANVKTGSKEVDA